MAAERVTAQATATAATRPRPDRRDTEPQRLRRPGISPLGELLMQWLSFRRRRPRRRPPCPCKRPWTSSWQERPRDDPAATSGDTSGKFPTLPNRIANRALRARRTYHRDSCPAGGLLHLFGRCPGSRKSRHLSQILRDPWTVLPLQTDPESTTGLGPVVRFSVGAQLALVAMCISCQKRWLTVVQITIQATFLIERAPASTAMPCASTIGRPRLCENPTATCRPACGTTC